MRKKSERTHISRRFEEFKKMFNIKSEEICKKVGLPSVTAIRMDGDHSCAESICVRDIKRICKEYNIDPDWFKL